MLTLAERCVLPIKSPLEMGSSILPVLLRLRESEQMVARFGDVFTEEKNSGMAINTGRIGVALAAYVRSIKPPRSPFSDYLTGDFSKLSTMEKRGLSVFMDKGQCSSCHRGEALSDGKLHVVMPLHGERRQAQQKRTEETRRKNQQSKEIMRALFRGNYGGRRSPEVLTPTLWDVSRTSPYFRDGSEIDLKAAVATHILEIREVGQEGKPILLTPLIVPAKLRPQWVTQADGVPPIPAPLTECDMDNLMSFLKTLSPRDI